MNRDHDQTSPSSPAEAATAVAVILSEPPHRPRPTTATVAVVFIAVVLAGHVLYAASALFVPFAVAVVIWYIINALIRLIGQIPLPGGGRVPRWAGLVLALLGIVVAVQLTMMLVAANIAAVTKAAPLYAENGKRLITVAFSWANMTPPESLSEFVRGIDFGPWIGHLVGALSNLASDLGMILIYVMFLLVAQASWDKKMRALLPDQAKRSRIQAIIDHIQGEIQAYLWLKTLLSILTGGVSYIVLATVGVDFASFWAFVIFLLNYIPTIGSILGVAAPAALALIQFGQPGPFLIVALGLGSVQFVIDNVLAPKLQEVRLGLDPVVLLLSLVGWGLLWGIAGMFLSVPLTVILMIILSHIPATRPIAILMSKDGTLK